jgi:hypothetical protein
MAMVEEEQEFVFNGIDGATGGYLTPPMTTHQVVELARDKGVDEDQMEASVRKRTDGAMEDFVIKAGLDPTNLSHAGWGVIFPAVTPSDKEAVAVQAAIREALQPLLDLRKAQASAIDERRYREISGLKSYRPGERKAAFLRNQLAPTSGSVDPDKLPYYLLVVGSPEQIPSEFQSQLGLQYAVGRLHFDTLDEYATYASTVVAAERGELALPRRMGLFGVKNDRATTLSAEGLIAGLDQYVRTEPNEPHAKEKLPAWALDVHTEAAATKDQLARMLGGPETPAVLFTASHGMGFPMAHRCQLAHQGALLCQDWPPRPGPVPHDAYFAGEDLGDSASLAGLIAFLFACYSGGTPKQDAFFHRSGERRQIAPHSFLARLPQRMLGHPRGGALAAVGHVDRAWGCSFFTPKVGHQIAVFESFMRELLMGKPIGYAMEHFGIRFGELSAGLVDKLEDLKWGGEVSELEIANDWTANNDARNYLILGDPAVRVPVAEDTQTQARSMLDLRSHADPASTTSPHGQQVVQQAPAKGEEGVSFGLFSKGKPAEAEDQPTSPSGGSMMDSLRGFVSKLGDKISEAIGDMSTLEVTTYVAKEMSEVRVENGKVIGAELRAYTAIELDGDTVVVVPERDGEIDRSALELHTSMVKQAQQVRIKLLETIVQAAASLVRCTK